MNILYELDLVEEWLIKTKNFRKWSKKLFQKTYDEIMKERGYGFEESGKDTIVSLPSLDEDSEIRKLAHYRSNDELYHEVEEFLESFQEALSGVKAFNIVNFHGKEPYNEDFLDELYKLKFNIKYGVSHNQKDTKDFIQCDPKYDIFLDNNIVMRLNRNEGHGYLLMHKIRDNVYTKKAQISLLTANLIEFLFRVKSNPISSFLRTDLAEKFDRHPRSLSNCRTKLDKICQEEGIKLIFVTATDNKWTLNENLDCCSSKRSSATR